ncbi:MAG: DUF309 domain-containing protein [Planctomycetes bacterium]|nr:DUF309 domain-containing protein [Planctomycetota bacterium]MCB9890926.1 DUF309 domain-containing protein [Planctomycetota bacterium]
MSCRDWLRGVDLFNHGFFWESHEAWEGLWRAQGRGDRRRLFLQGLIQTAAAHLQWLLGSTRGHERLRESAADKLRRFLAARERPDRPYGVALGEWLAATHAYWRSNAPAKAPFLPHPPLMLEPRPSGAAET